MSAVNESSKHELRGTSPWLFAPPAAGEDTDLGFLGFPSVEPCYSFCAGSGSHRHAGLGALRRGGQPWRARVSGCGAGAPRACAPQTAVLRAPLPSRPRVPDLTPVPARSQTTLRSCQFSRLSAELLVSDRKQRRGAKAAGQGERDREGEPRGAPGQGALAQPGCAASGSDRPAPRWLLLGSSLSPLSPSHFLPPRRLSSLLGPPFPLQSSCHTVRSRGFVFEDKKKKKKKNTSWSEVLSPRAKAQFLPLALARERVPAAASGGHLGPGSPALRARFKPGFRGRRKGSARRKCGRRAAPGWS